MPLTTRAQACIIKCMKRYIPLIILLITVLACALATSDVTAVPAYADDFTVVEFTFDSQDGQTEYVGDNFIAKVRDTGEILFSGMYSESAVMTAIEEQVGTNYAVIIPSPIVEISLQGDKTESEFSPVVHPFSLTGTASHPFWRIGEAFSHADSENGFEWRYSTEITDGAEVAFGGTASSVGFGGGRSHGVYTVRCKATVGFKFGNSTVYAADVSDGVELTITKASSEPDLSALEEEVEYGKSVKEILASKNTPSGVYNWSLEKGEFADNVPDVGNYAYSVVVKKGSYADGKFVADDNFSEYKTTLAVKISARKIYVKVADVGMVCGGAVPALSLELYDSTLANGHGIDDVGIAIANADFSAGKRNLTFKRSNENYVVYYMSTRNDGLSPQLIVYPDRLEYSDDNFKYTATRASGFDFDDVLTKVESDDGIALQILRGGEEVRYDDITLVLERAEGSNAIGITLGGGFNAKKIDFDGDGRIVLNGLGGTFSVRTSDSVDVDYVSLAIGLGGWVAAVLIGLALSLILIKGKRKSQGSDNATDLEIATAVVPQNVEKETVISCDEENATEETVAETTAEETQKNTVEIATENAPAVTDESACEKEENAVKVVPSAKNEKTCENGKNEQKHKFNSENHSDKTAKEIYDEQNKELFASVGFLPTPTVEEAFEGALEADIDVPDSDDENDGGKITFSSKMTSASVQNQAIYNALKNEILSYRGVKSRVVNGGDYFRRPGKQIAKIILIGKTIRLALALNPADYDYNLYHQKDRSGMKKYADTPMFVKVQSPLGVRRAVALIADLMEQEGLKKNKKYEYQDGMYTLTFGGKDEE